MSELNAGHPPCPKTRNRPAGNGTAFRKEASEHQETSEPVRDFQAEKLRRLYSFCHATACTIANLAFAVSR